MNWPLFFSTFALIFMAELGDKTQLAVMSQSAASSSKWTIFFAGALALAASTAIGVLAGDLIRRFVPDERYIKCVGGALFLIFGALMLREAFKPAEAKAAPGAPQAGALPATGWIGRFVLQQAAVFEQAAYEDYDALAAQTADPRVKEVFQRLAREERLHHEAMQRALAGDAGADIALTEELAAGLPPVSDLMHDASKVSEAVAHAIEHERAMASFYQALAKKTPLPRLRETFSALAVAEENHAQRLMGLRA